MNGNIPKWDIIAGPYWFEILQRWPTHQTCVCLNTHIHTHTHTHTQTKNWVQQGQTPTNTWNGLYTHIHTHIHTHTHMYTHLHIHRYIHTHTHTHNEHKYNIHHTSYIRVVVVVIRICVTMLWNCNRFRNVHFQAYWSDGCLFGNCGALLVINEQWRWLNPERY